MVLIHSALALALTGFAVVSYPFVWGLPPDFTPSPCELTQPVVQLSQGRVSGEYICPSNSSIERFLGIPFALPPLGKLRFDAPKPIPDNPNRTIDAEKYGPSCIPVASPYPHPKISEDCLTVNVIRPAFTSSSAKLPVMVWIYGGVFVVGSSESDDGSELINQSLAIERPIIFVSMNYRSNLFGFLASSEVEKRAKATGDAALNAGLLDQRLALQWVQKNIDAFGGDRDKVVVFGESAGAISTGAHLLSNRGEHSGLFRGAILQSGAAMGYPVMRAEKFNHSYTRLAEQVGCARAQPEVLDCLRGVPVDQFLDVLKERPPGTVTPATEYPDHVVQDGDFYDGRPSEALDAGKITRVPTIIGSVLDEGTVFTPRNLNSEEELRKHITKNWVFDEPEALPEILDRLLQRYPDIPFLGSPYPSPSWPDWDDNSRIFPPLESNQFKRTASMFGDLMLESGRRVQLDDIANAGGVGVWNYRFMQPPEDFQTYLGVYHSSDVPYVFAKWADQPGARGQISRMMSHSWIRFAHFLDPNGDTWFPWWPRFSLMNRETLQILYRNTTVVRDDYREEALAYMGRDAAWLAVSGR